MSQPINTSRDKNKNKTVANIKIKRILGLAGVLIALAIATIFLFITHHESNNTSTPQPSETTVKPIIKDALNKIEAQYPNAPTPNNDEVTNQVKKNSIETSTGKIISLSNGEFNQPSQPCKVSNITDFCIAATGKTPSLNFDVYFLKDAVHSRLFENSENFSIVKIPGSSAGGVMNMKLTKEDDVQALAVANGDSSGWLFIIKNNKSNNLNELTQNLRIG